MDSAGNLWAAIWWTCHFFLKPFACGQLLESAGTKHCHISFENSEVSVMGLSWRVECLLDSMWHSQTAFSVLCGSLFKGSHHRHDIASLAWLGRPWYSGHTPGTEGHRGAAASSHLPLALCWNGWGEASQDCQLLVASELPWVFGLIWVIWLVTSLLSSENPVNSE